MVLRLLGNLLRLLLFPLRWLRRARVLPKGGFVHVTIDGAVKDVVPEPRFWEQWRSRPLALTGLTKLVDEVIADPRARGVLLTLRSLRGGMATATSLRGVLARVTAAGRELVVHLPLGADTKELYVASVATRLYVGPQAVLAPMGFASAVRYVRRALDRAGVEPEVFARGRFKSAGEQLVRDSMSEPQREQLGGVLDAFYDEVVSGLASGRKVERDRAAAWIDGAPYLASDAVALGLADGVAYEDELPDLLGSGGERPRIVDGSDYFAAMRAPRFRRIRRPGVLGVITVHGPIASQSGAMQAGATDERVIAAVRRARSDGRVAAVVLHVDSPGGSALASDRMHHELERLAAEKPLVAYFADVAASGGYYVAAPAHAIVAQPTTITGSIGVVSARVVVEPLLAKLGVATEVLKRGAHADTLQPTRRLSDDERATFERELEGMYQAFVGIVARGRKRSVPEIERVAEGRVWSGVEGRREGLVDVLGGFDVACARARELAAAKLGTEKAARLEPHVVRGARHPQPPLDPPRQAAAAFAWLAGELGIEGSLALALGTSRERVLLWSEEARLLGR
ncbi:MAG TPA: signal peptide peptidase SppA [Polyangiaceae bacterium]|jgi:protease-4